MEFCTQAQHSHIGRCKISLWLVWCERKNRYTCFKRIWNSKKISLVGVVVGYIDVIDGLVPKHWIYCSLALSHRNETKLHCLHRKTYNATNTSLDLRNVVPLCGWASTNSRSSYVTCLDMTGAEFAALRRRRLSVFTLMKETPKKRNHVHADTVKFAKMLKVTQRKQFVSCESNISKTCWKQSTGKQSPACKNIAQMCVCVFDSLGESS